MPLVAFSCSPTAQTQKPTNPQTQKATNQTIDPTQYGVAKLAENIKARTFLYPAATIENFLDKDGVFTFGLHEKPLENAKGDWVALATEVKAYNNNELVAGSTPIKAEATADESKDPLKHEPRLTFKWSKATNNELKAGSYYTFIFYKKNGTEKIVYSKQNLDGNKDIFPVKYTNHSIDLKANGITLKPGFDERTFLYPAAPENVLDEQGVFTFKLHEKPLEGVEGDWVAFATKVKSATNNTIFSKETPVVKAEATADKSKDPLKHEPRLTFQWSKAKGNELENGAFYTFIFYKKDGSQRVVYSAENLAGNKDIFSVKASNQNIDPTKYGVAKLAENIDVRKLLHPAVKTENFLDKNGVFRFGLHETPLAGVTGEWIAIASEVKSETDNTLVVPQTVKIATATADETKEPVTKHERRLDFVWSEANKNKLDENKFYTFVFYKKDGTQKIVFGDENIKGNKDIFPTAKQDKEHEGLPTAKTTTTQS